ncbi:MAG: hypothetical protein H7263_09960 [Candidatus Sericytochromatia bacterium]|nr:hypothetical protein [Candidatus Sericytochromatia bacterium]
MIKLFSLVINLGEKKYSSQLYNQIIISLEKIPLKELSENELYKLAYSYININRIDKFKIIFTLIKSQALLNKLINNAIDIFTIREDINNLMSLINYVLNDSKTLDKILSIIISFITDIEKTNKITDTIIIY